MQICAHTSCCTCCESGPFYAGLLTRQTDKQCAQNRLSLLTEHKEPPVRAGHHQSVHLISSLYSRYTACTLYAFVVQVSSSCQMYSWHWEHWTELLSLFLSHGLCLLVVPMPQFYVQQVPAGTEGTCLSFFLETLWLYNCFKYVFMCAYTVI